jgi:hypothetical protein
MNFDFQDPHALSHQFPGPAHSPTIMATAHGSVVTVPIESYSDFLSHSPISHDSSIRYGKLTFLLLFNIVDLRASV